MQNEPDFFSHQILKARRFYRPGASSDGRARVISGGREFCREDFLIERESFPYVTLEFIVAGRGTCRIGNSQYDLEPGAVLFYGPEHPHQISAVPGAELHKYFVTVVPGNGIRTASRYGSVFYLQDSTPILRSFEELIDFGLNPSHESSRICLTIFNLIVQKCMFSAIDYEKAADDKFHKFLGCKAEISEHFLSLHSLNEAADHCAVSPGYLCKLFASYDHQTPYAYLMSLRMNDAARMVLDNNNPIQEIALQFGYQDQGHFTRVFKRHFGTSPSAMRTHHG